MQHLDERALAAVVGGAMFSGPNTVVRTGNRSVTTFASGAKQIYESILGGGQFGYRTTWTDPSGKVVRNAGSITRRTPTGSVTSNW